MSLSRRNALVGALASLPALAGLPAAATTEDPIFGLIAEHWKAWSRANAPGPDDVRDEDSDAELETLNRLCATEPLTIRGAATMAAYLVEREKTACGLPLDVAMQSIATALGRLR